MRRSSFRCIFGCNMCARRQNRESRNVTPSRHFTFFLAPFLCCRNHRGGGSPCQLRSVLVTENNVSLENPLERSQVFLAVVVVQNCEGDFQVRMCHLGERASKAFGNCMRTLAIGSATPGRQHKMRTFLHQSGVKQETNESLGIWS